jgi:hypothetical protein
MKTPFGDLTGYASPADNKVIHAIDSALHPGQIDTASRIIGVVTTATIWLAERTRFGRYSDVVGLGLASIVALSWWQASIILVGDTISIPRSLPMPHIPEILLVGWMLIHAVANRAGPISSRASSARCWSCSSHRNLNVFPCPRWRVCCRGMARSLSSINRSWFSSRRS